MLRLVLLLSLTFGCSPTTRSESPSSGGSTPPPARPSSSASAHAAASAASPSATSPSAAPSAAASSAASPSESAPPPAPDAGAAAGHVFAAPPLTDGDGKPLPQTEERPRTDSAFFRAAGERLFEAIVKDDAELALPFFFPVIAYEQVKDVKNPARDWEHRLVRLFRRDLHEYHRALGRRRGEAKFLRLEVPEARAEWMRPGREGNRIGYFRALRSRLVYADADGKERAFEVTSLISWRGEWYVVHLHGFE